VNNTNLSSCCGSNSRCRQEVASLLRPRSRWSKHQLRTTEFGVSKLDALLYGAVWKVFRCLEPFSWRDSWVWRTDGRTLVANAALNYTLRRTKLLTRNCYLVGICVMWSPRLYFIDIWPWLFTLRAKIDSMSVHSEQTVLLLYTVSQKKTSPTFLAITRESIDGIL